MDKNNYHGFLPGTIIDVALAANAATGEFSILIAALPAANPNIIKRLSQELDSTKVLASERIRTWQGGRIWQKGGVLTDANGRTSTIIDVDIQTSNGIIHVVDTVLLPNMNQDSDDDDE